MLARYNLFVKITKTLLISLAVIFLFLILFFNKSDNVAFVEESKSPSPKLSGSEVNVGSPVFSSNGENSYRIFAESINKASGDTYNLNRISGIYNLENTENITINAINCALNQEEDSAKLRKDVKIGYENYLMITDKMDIDLKNKSAKNNDFVMIIGNNAKISADRFKTNEDFCEVTFDGNVRGHFNLSNAE